MPDHGPVAFLAGDVLRLCRTHPCGGDTWLVDRLGADIGLRCQTCGRHLLVERSTLERRVTVFVERGKPGSSAPIAPGPRGGMTS